jgi:hypothetical protein
VHVEQPSTNWRTLKPESPLSSSTALPSLCAVAGLISRRMHHREGSPRTMAKTNATLIWNIAELLRG